MSTYPPGYAAPNVPIFVPEADAISSFNTGSLSIPAGGDILMGWNDTERSVHQWNKDVDGLDFVTWGVRSIPVWDASGVLIPSTNTLTLANSDNKFDMVCVGALQVKGIKDVGVLGQDIGAAIYSDENGAILMSNVAVSSIAVGSALLDAIGKPGDVDQVLVSGGPGGGPVWVTAKYTAFGFGNTGASSNVVIDTVVDAAVQWADPALWAVVVCPTSGGAQYSLTASTIGISSFEVAGSNDIPFSWIAVGTPLDAKFP